MSIICTLEMAFFVVYIICSSYTGVVYCLTALKVSRYLRFIAKPEVIAVERYIP